MKLRRKYVLTPEETAARETASLRKEHRDHADWVVTLKQRYREIWEEALSSSVIEREDEFKKVAGELVPRLPWKRKAFWAGKRYEWREQAAKSVAEHTERELALRNVEATNLQLRLSLVLTFTMAIVAVVSLRQAGVAWTTSIAATAGCILLGIALIPMWSNFAQAWRNKFTDPGVWSSQATDYFARFCLASSSIGGRNRVITRYKRVLWGLVPLLWLALSGIAALYLIPLFK